MGVVRKKCKTPMCPNLHRNASGYCDSCMSKNRANANYRKTMRTDTPMENRESPNARGYSWEWRMFAKKFLQRHPTCALCGKPARVVDHKNIPAQIMLDMYGKFLLDENEYQALCVSCNTWKAKEDKKKVQEYFEIIENAKDYEE